VGIYAACAVPHPPLLVPGIGDDSKQYVQKTHQALVELSGRIMAHEPETLIIVSPHAPLYADYFHMSSGAGAKGDFGFFCASKVSCSVVYDQEFIAMLEEELAQRGIPGGTQGEADSALDHGTMVPLHYLCQAAGKEGDLGANVKIIRVGISGLSYEKHLALGKALASVANRLNRRVALVASGDLSHKLKESGPYGYAPEGPELDKQICAALASGSASEFIAIDRRLSEAGAECGLKSFIVMSGALEGLDYRAELLSYEGPLGVGYAVASYMVNESISELAQASPSFCLPTALARQTLQSFFSNKGKRPALDCPEITRFLERCHEDVETRAQLEALAHRRAGVFVSLHEENNLRGCIGTIVPTQESVLAEIVQNAVSAAREDSRFLPVREEELAYLTIKVDVLGEAEPVSDRSDLDAKRYGVIVSLGRRRGLLLPALEGVDTPEEQIGIALAKAGIGAHETYELERFEVVRYQ